MLKVENLSLTKKNKILLQAISSSFPNNVITFLLGKSGSGKTSLLRCLTQLEKPCEGKLLFNEKPLKELTQQERRSLIGFVPQGYALFPHMSALENCTHPLRTILRYSKQRSLEIVKELFAFLDLQGKEDSYPHELSGGQQQRVAIARALGLSPLFILLDEPTSALDPENTNRLTHILQKLKERGKGVIIASQDMPFAASIFDKALFLEEGRVVEVAENRESLGTKLKGFLSEK